MSLRDVPSAARGDAEKVATRSVRQRRRSATAKCCARTSPSGDVCRHSAASSLYAEGLSLIHI
eukprot:3928327-Alexandrium_andersonii.AAC.1